LGGGDKKFFSLASLANSLFCTPHYGTRGAAPACKFVAINDNIFNESFNSQATFDKVIPALCGDDVTEMLAVLGRVGTVEEIVVVGAAATGSDVMSDVIVDRDDVDAGETDVDPDVGVAIPKEVGDLLRVGDVVCRLQLSGCLKVIQHRSSAVDFYRPQPFTQTI